MVGGILLAAAYLGFGAAIFFGTFFVIRTLWIVFIPNEDQRMAKLYRKRAK